MNLSTNIQRHQKQEHAKNIDEVRVRVQPVPLVYSDDPRRLKGPEHKEIGHRVVQHGKDICRAKPSNCVIFHGNRREHRAQALEDTRKPLRTGSPGTRPRQQTVTQRRRLKAPQGRLRKWPKGTHIPPGRREHSPKLGP